MKVHFLADCECTGSSSSSGPLALLPVADDWGVCRRCCALYRCIAMLALRGGALHKSVAWVRIPSELLAQHLAALHIADKLVLVDALDHFRRGSSSERGQA